MMVTESSSASCAVVTLYASGYHLFIFVTQRPAYENGELCLAN
jgi:hypothetical protein